MKTVLVTGGYGFIGRYVIRELRENGYDVRVLDALIEQVHGPGARKDGGEVDFIHADIRDADAVAKAVRGVDAVIHLAAEVGVGQSMYEIERYVGVNELGTANLLQALIDNPVETLVVASSMSVYGEGLYETADGTRVGNARRKAAQVKLGLWDPVGPEDARLTPVPTDETKPVDLASIYALNKFAQERACLLVGEAYGMNAAALRLFNVFGPGQALSNPYTGVLANFASRLANGQPPLIFEDGAQRRDFVHVRDVALAFRLALERPRAAGEVINVGSGNAYSIAEVARLLAAAMDLGIEPEIMNKARAGDIRNCYADIGKARDLLYFEPRFRLQDTLGELADWVAGEGATDRSADMRRHLEARGLVS
ncbi:NAD-dependent epimerase/dehydratase family protein [Roseitranquillus sediminis]|uniref:NAD-dependent epimerase/dehydratase family protein n=1 Tax=Roseitranquillus sediminis TaxID=2809051 RepID=UPI001D0C44AB|nr:SDR family NAD(P)-dependent oxidoreductase [Roseitranquillus sediminis]MBM9593374.1 SDR family NAD(P)-dependent oxidoreductase [Roseitranquillus sediminis]